MKNVIPFTPKVNDKALQKAMREFNRESLKHAVDYANRHIKFVLEAMKEDGLTIDEAINQECHDCTPRQRELIKGMIK